MGATTREALSSWHETAEDVLDVLTEKMDEEDWMDLPPITEDLVIAAVNAMADLRDLLKKDMVDNGIEAEEDLT